MFRTRNLFMRCLLLPRIPRCARYGAGPGISEFLLAHRDRLSCSDCWNGASYDSRDLADLRHQFIELVGEQRLWAVGERLIGLVMHFDHQSIGADGDGGARQRSDLVALAGSVTGIDKDRQMA